VRFEEDKQGELPPEPYSNRFMSLALDFVIGLGLDLEPYTTCIIPARPGAKEQLLCFE
jgi:hypothetical protein